MPQHRDEHVFQRRCDGANLDRRKTGLRQVILHPLGISVGRACDHVHAIAEHADRQEGDSPIFSGRFLPQNGGGLARLGSADLQNHTPHESLHFRGRAAGQQLAAMDQCQAMASLGLVEIGGGDEDRHLLLLKLIENPPEIPPRHRINAVGRLVEEEYLGCVDQRAGQPEFLFHAAGQVARQAATKRRQIAEGQEPFGPLRRPLRGTL